MNLIAYLFSLHSVVCESVGYEDVKVLTESAQHRSKVTIGVLLLRTILTSVTCSASVNEVKAFICYLSCLI